MKILKGLFLLLVTATTLGNTTYINDWNGETTTITKIGNFDYYQSSDGGTATGYQMGNYYYLTE